MQFHSEGLKNYLKIDVFIFVRRGFFLEILKHISTWLPVFLSCLVKLFGLFSCICVFFTYVCRAHDKTIKFDPSPLKKQDIKGKSASSRCNLIFCCKLSKRGSAECSPTFLKMGQR